MNPVNSASSSANKPAKSLTYRLAKGLFEAPGKVDSFVKAKQVGKDAFMSGPRNAVTNTVGHLVKGIVDYDYRAFPVLSLGKHSISLAEPPKGALLLLLYPGTVIPRLYRAYQRGKQNNDYREMGDVLRRDLTAITLFVFALGPVVQKLSALTQRMTGVKLLDPESKAVLKYSQFKNYQIDSPAALKALLTEDNGKALLEAVNGLHDRGLSQKFPNDEHAKELNKAIESIKTHVKALVDGFEAHNKGKEVSRKVWPEALNGSAKATHEAFKHAENLRKDAILEAKRGGSAEMAQIAEKMQGEFTGVLQNAAKAHRLPSDLVSFAILVGAIGYLPMWFNTQWNKRQFEKKMAAKAAAEQTPKKNSQTPPPSYQKAIKTPPAYQQPGTSQNLPLSAPPLYASGPVFGTFGQPAPQPFGFQNRQLPPNPFNRTV